MEELLNKPVFVLLLVTWTFFWKGLALWRAAKNDQKYWFIVILIINIFGIVEIAYLVWFAKKNRFWDKISVKVGWKS